MYWKNGTEKIAAPTIPSYTIGENYDFTFTLVTEAGEELDGAYLFCADPDHSELLQAKLSSESSYKNIKGPFDATCILGYIAGSTETSIDIRIAFPESTSDGYRVITLLVGQDAVAEQESPYFFDDWTDFWFDDWTDFFVDEW